MGTLPKGRIPNLQLPLFFHQINQTASLHIGHFIFVLSVQIKNRGNNIQRRDDAVKDASLFDTLSKEEQGHILLGIGAMETGQIGGVDLQVFIQ